MNMGNILLYGALILSCLSLFFIGKSASGNRLSMVSARQIFYLAGIMILFSFLLLTVSFLNDDFRFLYVYENSSFDLPVAYKAAAVWAGKEGSFLLWLLFLSLAGFAVTRTERSFENIILGLVIITQVFILLLLVAESPFRFIWDVYPEDFTAGKFLPEGFDGLGMNPLLADPWMVSHPPLLFLGYASSIIPFGYAAAGIIRKDYTSWLDRSCKWVLFSVAALGTGIFLGGYWAYTVLGWGGFWGWDPVENSSLIPWLAAVALLHVLLIQKRKGALVRTGLVLAFAYPVLVFYSTYLTRSGVLSDFSVHSFGGGGVSGYILFFLLFYIVLAAALIKKSISSVRGKSLSEKMWAWDSLTLYGSAALVIFGLIILTGTSMPILSGLAGNPASVTAKFYNSLSIPFGLIILVFMILGTVSMRSGSVKENITAGILAAAGSAAVNISFSGNITAWIFTLVSFFAVVRCIEDLILVRKKSLFPSRLAHCGTALFAAGCIASGFYTETFSARLVQGHADQLGPVTLTFVKFNEGRESSISFRMENGSAVKEFSCPYFMSGKGGGLYRAPYISSGISGDIYISAEEYTSGKEMMSRVSLSKGEKRSVCGLNVEYRDLSTAGMMSENPSVFAELLVNGKRVKTGFIFENGKRQPLPGLFEGRQIFMEGFDPGEKTVSLFVEPGKDSRIPADTVLVDVSVKHLIWFVWAGTVLIVAGGVLALTMRKSGKQS